MRRSFVTRWRKCRYASRSSILKTSLKSDLRWVSFREDSEKKLTQQIEKELCYEVKEMIRYGARSGILKTSLLSNLLRVIIREKSEKKLIQQIEKEICNEVEETIRYGARSSFQDHSHVRPALGQLQAESEEKLIQQIEMERCYELEEMIRYGAHSSILMTSPMSDQQIEKELCYKVEEMIRYGLPRSSSSPLRDIKREGDKQPITCSKVECNSACYHYWLCEYIS